MREEVRNGGAIYVLTCEKGGGPKPKNYAPLRFAEVALKKKAGPIFFELLKNIFFSGKKRDSPEYFYGAPFLALLIL